MTRSVRVAVERMRVTLPPYRKFLTSVKGDCWYRRVMRLYVIASVLAGVVSASAADLPNRVATGDTTSASTVLWARTNQPDGQIRFRLSEFPDYRTLTLDRTVQTGNAWIPAMTYVSGLKAGTQYYFRATDSAGNQSGGRFRTAPKTGSRGGFRFGVSGDSRGDYAPYPALKNVTQRNLNLFFSIGDTIYADVSSPNVPVSQAKTLDEYRRKSEEPLALRYSQSTLAVIRQNMSWGALIDDHEVTNTFSGAANVTNPDLYGTSSGPVNLSPLYQNGMTAFSEYHPMLRRFWTATGDTTVDGRDKLYRQIRYGGDCAIFTLDPRSFRVGPISGANQSDPNSISNFLNNAFTPNRALLGNPQLNQVMLDLLIADRGGITWKFVMIPEPIQNLGLSSANDRYEGYAHERSRLLKFVDDWDIRNVVFIGADIHGSITNNLSYQDAAFGPQKPIPSFEVTVGPIAAGTYAGGIVNRAISQGYPGALTVEQYNALPLDQKEAYIEWAMNYHLEPLGYSPVGLEDSRLDFTLEQGSWTVTNTYGWTEFDIAPITGVLTVTIYGITPYSKSQMDADPVGVYSRNPEVLSRYSIRPGVILTKAP